MTKKIDRIRVLKERRPICSYGTDLKVGGEGMKGFYDKIVPEVANKLGKQFGAKVQSTKIDASNRLHETWDQNKLQ